MRQWGHRRFADFTNMTLNERPPRALIAVWACALLLFLWLAAEVRRGAVQPFDDVIRTGVHAWAAPWLTTVMRGFSQLGEPAFLIVLGALIIATHLWSGRPRTALLFFVIVAGAEGVDQLLKIEFHRVRPVAFFGIAEPMGYSFPSGHALVSCTFFGVLAALAATRTKSRARRWLYFVAAAAITGAIGLSRIYLGVHYPSDVLGGYLAAAIWVLSVAAARRLRRLRKPMPPRHNT